MKLFRNFLTNDRQIHVSQKGTVLFWSEHDISALAETLDKEVCIVNEHELREQEKALYDSVAGEDLFHIDWGKYMKNQSFLL